ncbi:MAG: hypothetical protein MJA27_06595 [Pseudanabaenales cyanobacterium]|nr:hypothetical protein [Pseudanabaenales cyanobacterium]
MFGPVGIAIAFTVTGITLSIWLNNGGWEQIGEIIDITSRGISGTLDELRRILNRAGPAAIEQFNDIEDYLRNNVFPASNTEEDRQARGAIREIERIIGRRLSDDERTELHNAIHGQGYGFWEIVIVGVQMFGAAEDLDKIPKNRWPEDWR